MSRLLFAPIVGALLLVWSCSAPPDKERHQAEGAIAAAREAGAATYATAELASAQAALDKYDAAVAQRDYRLALSLAVEARDTAYHAAKRAADNKAAARADAERLAADLAEQIGTARTKLAAVPARQPQASAKLRAALTAAETSLQESRAAMERQEYQAAIEHLPAVTAALRTELDAAPAAPPRRGR